MRLGGIVSMLLAGCATAPGPADDAGGALVIPDDNLVYALGDCDGAQREPPEYPNQLFPGDELERATLTDPRAVCNDGTPAVMYVRPWTDPALADTWSIHLQGGDACAGYAECATRWCGTGYYDRSKMSSDGLPLTIGAVGIYDAAPENQLAGANQVWFYYCSSDFWYGQGIGAFPSPGDGLPAYSLFRRGHAIVDAGITALEAGVVGDGGTAMPPLAEAGRVVFSGSSAGGVGAIAHADWLTDRLDGAEVVAVFDAAAAPPSAYYPPDAAAELDAVLVDAWDQQVETNDVLPFLDASCTERVAPSEVWRCYATPDLVAHDVSTPFFFRYDLRDPKLEPVVSEDENEANVAAWLADLSRAREVWPDGAPMTVDPGVYGPNCAVHVALETVDWWRVATVDDGGTPTTFQAAAGRWWLGESIAVIDAPAAGDGDGLGSTCPGTEAAR